jgi:hypothetical protein
MMYIGFGILGGLLRVREKDLELGVLMPLFDQETSFRALF